MKSYYSILIAIFILLIGVITYYKTSENWSNKYIHIKDSAITHPASWT